MLIKRSKKTPIIAALTSFQFVQKPNIYGKALSKQMHHQRPTSFPTLFVSWIFISKLHPHHVVTPPKFTPSASPNCFNFTTNSHPSFLTHEYSKMHFTSPGFKSQIFFPVLTYEYSELLEYGGRVISEMSTDFLPVWLVGLIKKSLHPH